MSKTTEPSPEQRGLVELCAAAGLTLEQASEVAQLNRKTLQRKCRKEWEYGRSRANAKVAGSLFNLAIKGNVTAAIFWLKAQAGWRDHDDDKLIRVPVGGGGGVEVHVHLPVHPRLVQGGAVDAVRQLPAPGGQ